MKKPMLFLCLLGLSALATYGQNTKGGQALLESQPVKKEKEEKKVPAPTAPKSTNEILGKRVEFGGYFTDLFKADNKRALFDLKTPLDPKKDLENLSFYPRTEHVQAVILFSIKH
jgi:hypothetical protein